MEGGEDRRFTAFGTKKESTGCHGDNDDDRPRIPRRSTRD
jgi:hypothetical protein